MWELIMFRVCLLIDRELNESSCDRLQTAGLMSYIARLEIKSLIRSHATP